MLWYDLHILRINSLQYIQVNEVSSLQIKTNTKKTVYT